MRISGVEIPIKGEPNPAPAIKTETIEDLGAELKSILGRMRDTKGGGETSVQDFFEELSKAFDAIDKHWGVAAVLGTVNGGLDRTLVRKDKLPIMIGRQTPIANLINDVVDIMKRVEDIYGKEIIDGALYLIREMKLMIWIDDLRLRRVMDMRKQQAEQQGV